MLTSDARARTDVILTGQCESHFTTSFSANAICERSGEGFTSFNGNKLSNLCGEKSTMKLSGVSIFREHARQLGLKCRSHNHPLPQI